MIHNTFKTCAECAQEKSGDHFHDRFKNKQRLPDYCDECYYRLRKKWKATTQKKWVENNREYVRDYMGAYMKTYVPPVNEEKERQKLEKRAQRAEHIEISRRNREYAKNVDTAISISFRLLKEDPEFILIQKANEARKRRQYEKDRKQRDPAFKAKCLIRSQLKKFMRGMRRSVRSQELLACTYPEFVAHMDGQMTPQMTWENQGEYWHVDHVIPQSKFNHLDEADVRRCWHYTNLRPLEAVLNVARQDDEWSDERIHQERIARGLL